MAVVFKFDIAEAQTVVLNMDRSGSRNRRT